MGSCSPALVDTLENIQESKLSNRTASAEVSRPTYMTGKDRRFTPQADVLLLFSKGQLTTSILQTGETILKKQNVILILISTK